MEVKMSLGVAIIAQNNAETISALLPQFYHVADDLVVVDGGSTDDTSEWARRLGARVFYRMFVNDFSAQRNYAISQLTSEWIYMHDTDERLEPTLVGILKELISPEGQRALMSSRILPQSEELFDCFGFARRTFVDGVQTEDYPDYQYRLFRNYCRFEGKVHEKLTGYRNATEVDFARPGKEGTEPMKLDFPSELSVLDDGKSSRFNILHYKSSKIKQKQDELYRMIMEGER